MASPPVTAVLPFRLDEQVDEFRVLGALPRRVLVPTQEEIADGGPVDVEQEWMVSSRSSRSSKPDSTSAGLSTTSSFRPE